jgi:hypothetical protein
MAHSFLATVEKVMDYTTPRNIRRFFLAYGALALGAVGGFLLQSTVLFIGFAALSIMLWWPIARDLVPVCFSVVVKGRWPDGSNISNPL